MGIVIKTLSPEEVTRHLADKKVGAVCIDTEVLHTLVLAWVALLHSV